MNRLRTAAAALMLVLGVGCSPTIETNAPPGPLVQYPNGRLVLASSELIDEVALLEPRMRTVGQLKEAEIAIQNLEDEDLFLEYKLEWEDADGFKTGTGNAAWHPFRLSPYATVRFRGTAPSVDGQVVIVTVRESLNAN
jgi:uncharacterized protein YcfL